MNMNNLTMVCYDCSSCIDLPVALVDFQLEGCPLRLHHACQGGYVLFYDIYFEGEERKICCKYVEKLGGGGGKSEKLNKVGYSTVSKTVELEKEEKEV